MTRQIIAPAPDDKIGKKIDFIAKSLSAILEPYKFARKARTLFAEKGESYSRCWQIINLQGDKWNEGAEGKFYVNVAIQFPAIHTFLAQSPAHAWHAEWANKPDEAAGQTRRRIENVIHQSSASQWKLLLPLWHDRSLKISRESDLHALAEQLGQAIISSALPWLDKHSPLSALRDSSDSDLLQSPISRLVAAILLGDKDAGNSVIAAHASTFKGYSVKAFAEIHNWIQEAEFDVSLLPERPSSPRSTS